MSMPRPNYHSFGKRGPPHGSHRGHSMPPPHQQMQRMTPLPPPQTPPMEQPPQNHPVEEPMPSAYSNHEQVVKFVRDAWIKIKKDLNEPPDDPNCHVMYYTEPEPNPALKDFVPYDLEELCKRRKHPTS